MTAQAGRSRYAEEMLHEFLAANRSELIERTRAKVALRFAPRPTDEELDKGIPLFLDQLVVILRTAGKTPDLTELGKAAARYGAELIACGFTVSQVVRDYGDLCQTVTELAHERGAPISAEEFHTFNLCLDDAIAEAVSEYARIRERRRAEEERERLGSLAHELRNRLSAAMLAFSAIKSGRVPFGGSTGHMLWRNLRMIRDLVDNSLAQVRLESGSPDVKERILVAELIENVEVEASLDAEERAMSLTVAAVPRDLAIEGDPAMLTAAVVNLLQNAFKFTHPEGHVSLTTSATAQRVVFDIEDECGGLPAGVTEELFAPYTQRGENRRGLGLGLTISRRAIARIGGELRVRDLPGRGCIFTIDLPRAL